MNRLEGQVRPLLTPLIEGSPVALDFEQMSVIARWVTLKCIVAEHGERGIAVTPEHDRFAFRNQGIIPDFFRIYIANHNMDLDVGFMRHASRLSLTPEGPDPPLIGTGQNIQTISFTLGRVFVHLNAARVKNYSIESRFMTEPYNVWDHCRIWPLMHHEMIWPRRPMLDRNSIDAVSRALEIIIANSTINRIG
jgi:hypothetical protein